MQLLIDHDNSALPVIEGNRRVIGILSEADLPHRERIGTENHRAWWIEAITPPSVLALDYAKSHGRRVAELMSESVMFNDFSRNQNRDAGMICSAVAAASSQEVELALDTNHAQTSI